MKQRWMPNEEEKQDDDDDDYSEKGKNSGGLSESSMAEPEGTAALLNLFCSVLERAFGPAF